jgi:hypothetical protein
VEAATALCWLQPEGLECVVERLAQPRTATSAALHWLAKISDANALYALRERLIERIEGEPEPPNPRQVRLAEALGVIRDPRIGQMIAVQACGRAYRVGKYPVTQQEYAQFTQDSGREPPQHWIGSAPPPERSNHPVTNVSWEDATAFCEWLSARRKARVRLPTAEEWVDIAQAGAKTRRYPWGAQLIDRAANCRSAAMGVTAVGLFPAGESQHGVADLLGNVWEWTAERSGRREPPEYIIKGGAYDTVNIGEGVWLEKTVGARMAGPNIGFRVLEEEGRPE